MIDKIAEVLVVGLALLYSGLLGYTLGINKAYRERDCSRCFLKIFKERRH